ncbi:MAG: hypothetical protein WDO18_12175 [Acidobacteriota bacterium]
MGGVLELSTYSVPYVFAKFPEDLDAFDYAAITGKGVWLRAKPSATSRGVRQLSYDIVRVLTQSRRLVECRNAQRTTRVRG